MADDLGEHKDTADHSSRHAPPCRSRQKVQARSAVPFAIELLPRFLVYGTWNVPTTFAKIPGGRHMECAYYFEFCRLCPQGMVPPTIRENSDDDDFSQDQELRFAENATGFGCQEAIDCTCDATNG